MSTRNLAWLALIVAVAVVGSIAFDGVLWGVLGGLVVLVASEITERSRRRRRAAAAGAEVPRPLRSSFTRKPQRR